MDRTRVKLYSGGHRGTEAEFGRCARRWEIPAVTFSFEGHQMEWGEDVRMHFPGELAEGDVSMAIVSNTGRTYHAPSGSGASCSRSTTGQDSGRS
jgi:hypothetical protein